MKAAGFDNTCSDRSQVALPPSVGKPTGLLRRLLCGAKAPVVARFVPASGWKLAYTHNERRQSSLKATQCCGSALSPKDSGAIYKLLSPCFRETSNGVAERVELVV